MKKIIFIISIISIFIIVGCRCPYNSNSSYNSDFEDYSTKSYGQSWQYYQEQNRHQELLSEMREIQRLSKPTFYRYVPKPPRQLYPVPTWQNP